MIDIENLISEQQNENTRNLDQLSVLEICQAINSEDGKIAAAVAKCLPQIAAAAESIAVRIQQGGRLLYFGAGTSGRLGILDASECPPTYGTDPSLVIGIIAGGQRAIQEAVEGIEDDRNQGKLDVISYKVSSADAVVGISASGRTPYVIGVMEQAKQIGATVIGVANNENSEMGEYASVMIEAVVGSEVVLGSTRMKAGSAQKMILNMLTTTAMIVNGKVYDNLMIDMQPSNEKLVYRAKRLIEMATGADPVRIETAFHESQGHVKTAIVMIKRQISAQEAGRLLAQTNGYLRKAIELV